MDINFRSSLDKDLSEIASLLESLDPDSRATGNRTENNEVICSLMYINIFDG